MFVFCHWRTTSQTPGEWDVWIYSKSPGPSHHWFRWINGAFPLLSAPPLCRSFTGTISTTSTATVWTHSIWTWPRIMWRRIGGGWMDGSPGIVYFPIEFYFISSSLLTSSQKGIWTRIRVPSVQENRNTGFATGLNVVQGIYIQVDTRGIRVQGWQFHVLWWDWNSVLSL